MSIDEHVLRDHRLAALVRLSARLNARLEPERVAQIVCEEVVALLRCSGAIMLLLDAVEGRPIIWVNAGVPEERWPGVVEGLEHADLWTYPADEPIRVMTAPDDPVLQALSATTLVCAHLSHAGEVLGMLYAFTDSASNPLPAPDQLVFTSMLDQAAQALVNAHLLEKSRRDLQERTRATTAQRFLADAGAVLTASLDVNETLVRATQLAIPLLADICVVYSSDEQHAVQPISVAHIQPERVEHVLKMIRGFPPDPNGTHPVAVALREERSIFLRDLPIPPAALIRSPEHLETVRQVGFASSAIIVPLRARGRKYGVLALTRLEHSPQYEPSDLWLAEELARRIGLALDNAQLYQQAQASEERHRIISELVSDYAYAFRIDAEHRLHVEWITDAFARMTGFDGASHELTGSAILELTHPDDRSRLIAHYAELIAGQPSTLEFRIAAATGEIRWIENTARPIFDAEQGRIVRIYGVSRDITVQRETQYILQHERELLAQRVAEQTADLARALRSRDEFLSRMSHELRTPLHAILGFAQLMEIEEREAGGNKRVKRILEAGRHLLDLINEVLDITRIDAGRIELSLQPVNVRACLYEAVASLQSTAAARHITITDTDLTCSDWVLADHARLTQVLTNVLSNAIKFNYDHGTVTIHCEQRADDRLYIYIADTGQGIADELQQRLFVPFERLGAQRRGVDGTGLGLALSRRLMEIMGGTIGVHSTPGEGSTFWIDLPRAGAPAEPIDIAHFHTGSA